MKISAILIGLTSLFLTSIEAHALEAVYGTFTATKTCEATKKLQDDNPGLIRLEVGRGYELREQNRKKGATHYHIIVPNAPESEMRWVSISCGDANIIKRNSKIKRGSIENLIAISWMPAFCQSNEGVDKYGNPKTECKNLSPDKPYATQFSIHGLWPNDLDDLRLYPCYCNLDKPISCTKFIEPVASISIPNDLRSELKDKMPGIQSGFLHRHEWTKHGTCYEKYDQGADKGADEEEYYRDTIHILDQFNASKVGALFKDNLGDVLTAEEINEAIDESFGEGASEHIFLECNSDSGEPFWSEIYIGLGGVIDETSDLSTLIQASPKTKQHSAQTPCEIGWVPKVK